MDKRSDIWAFGCVLYEMLTGTRAFEGEMSPTRWRACRRERAGLGPRSRRDAITDSSRCYGGAWKRTASSASRDIGDVVSRSRCEHSSSRLRQRDSAIRRTVARRRRVAASTAAVALVAAPTAAGTAVWLAMRPAAPPRVTPDQVTTAGARR